MEANVAEFRERFNKLVGHISRPGLDDLLAWLDKTDFFTSPASTKFHGNYVGGLVEHSVQVVEYALTVFNWTVKYRPELEYLRESIIICGLFHDVCKVNQYSMGEQFTKDDNNRWVKYMGWKYEDKFPMGHGEKSVYYVSKYMELTQPEVLAIRYHMGQVESNSGMGLYSYQSAFENPLVKIIIAADIVSTAVAPTIDYKKTALTQ